MHFLYILRCKDGSLYTGIARDVPARVKLHRTGRGSKYVKSRGVKKLVYTETLESLTAAMKREREIKSWPRERKERLIAIADVAQW